MSIYTPSTFTSSACKFCGKPTKASCGVHKMCEDEYSHMKKLERIYAKSDICGYTKLNGEVCANSAYPGRQCYKHQYIRAETKLCVYCKKRVCGTGRDRHTKCEIASIKAAALNQCEPQKKTISTT